MGHHVTSVAVFGRREMTHSEPWVVHNCVLPREHLTWPSLGSNERLCGCANLWPSRQVFWLRAAEKKSFSRIEGDGGRMNVGVGGVALCPLPHSMTCPPHFSSCTTWLHLCCTSHACCSSRRMQVA